MIALYGSHSLIFVSRGKNTLFTIRAVAFLFSESFAGTDKNQSSKNERLPGRLRAVSLYSILTFTGLTVIFPAPSTVYHLPFGSLIFSDTPDVMYPIV